MEEGSEDKEDANQHHCQLSPKRTHNIDIVQVKIETGILVEFRRKLRRCTMINRNHPLTLIYIRSANELRLEQRRHLLMYPHMIHPFSMFSLWLNFFMLICYLYIYLAYTVQYVINQDILTMYRLYGITTPFYVPLIIASFFTGYHDIHRNRIILGFRSVFWHYVTSYMIFDLLFLSCIYFVVCYYDLLLIYPYTAFAVLPPCAFARYPYFVNGLKLFRIYVGMGIPTFTCIKISISTMTFFLFIFAYIFALVRHIPYNEYMSNKASRSYEMLHHWLKELERLFAYTEVISTVGQAHINIKSSKYSYHYTADLVPIIFIPLGFVCQVWIAVKLMRFWHNYYSNDGKNDLMHLQFNGYLRYKALPLTLQNKINTFLDFKFQRQIYEEQRLNEMVTDKLRKEILVNATRYKLQQVELFKHFPEKLFRKLLTLMELDVFMPGDVIVKAGATGTCMFFVSVGTVSVTTRSGKEVCVLRDGSHVGEIALITRTARVANVTAVTPCELYRLKSKHFQKVMEKYPELLEEMRELAFGRIAKTKSLMSRTRKSLSQKDKFESEATLEEDTDLDESDIDIVHLL